MKCGRLPRTTAPRLYAHVGPFAQRGVELAQGNERFDTLLKQRELGWGLREVEWLDELSENHDLTKVAEVCMPSDNLTLIYAATPAAKM